MSLSVPARTSTSELTDGELDRLRMALAQLAAELDEQMRSASRTLAQLREDFSLTDPDVQAPLMTALHSLDTAERTAIDVADALARMEAGTYGACGRCRGTIPLARLEIRPAGRFCVSCSR
jgi:DnaK suppressor protein